MTLRKEIESVEDYNKAMLAADYLGLELKEAYFYGTWVTKENDTPCWPKDSEIEQTLNDHFFTELDGELYMIRPDEEDDDARLVLRFE